MAKLRILLITLFAPLLAAAVVLPTATQTAPNPLRDLHFRFIGPLGNRDIAVVGVPGNPLVDYFGAASGGIWKTTDGGVHFKPVFDKEDVSAIGALAIAPSAPNIIWAGTGEPYIIRGATSLGDGVYKSTDSGETWRHMGLGETGHIEDIAINPYDPNVVYVCAVGQAYKPNPERGVYRTEDGGQTWQQVLKVDDTTGCSGLSLDPHDPQTLFAGMWQIDIKPWDENSGGPGSGVFVTHDGGSTWARISGHGLPPVGADLGKIAVRVAPSDSNRVYALIQETTSALYRSDDGGAAWTLVNQSHQLDERSPYYTNFRVAPNDENRLYFVSVSWTESWDGGRSFVDVPSAGGDLHDVWIDPRNPQRIMVADDIGGAISLNGGKTYQRVMLPIAQIYHVYTDNQIPYNVLGNRQDSGAEEGPSRSLFGFGRFSNGIPPADWHGYDGCESGFGVPDPVDPNVIWSGCYNGGLVRVDLRTGQPRSVEVWPEATYGWAPAKVRDRWNWTFPIAISPHNHNEVYVGSQYVYATTDGGQSWKRISPDLTLNDKSREGDSGGVAFDNLMTFSSETLSDIAESPVKPGIIWVGSYDGQVSVTQDGGAHWTNVTANIPNLPPWGTISNVEPSKYDAGTAYISDDLMMMGDYSPYIFKTTDYGKTWVNISGDIPRSEFSFVHIVREDPVRKGMLYAGTENSIYFTLDDGGHWTLLKNNFPAAPVYWLTIQPQFNDLVVGTYGRGIWILDDITPLRSWDRISQAVAPSIFVPRPAYRFRISAALPENNPNGVVMGENPPYGADLDYYLPAEAPVEISIIGSNGETICSLRLHGHAGLNRAWWDLRYASPLQAHLLTSPPGESWVTNGPQGWRPLVSWAHEPPGPLVVPGTYTVTLTVDGQAAGSQPLQVLAGPHTLGTQASMEAQQRFLLQLRSEINETVVLINHIERTRKQLENADVMLANRGQAARVLAASQSLEQQDEALEGRLFDVELTDRPEDSFRHAMQLYGQLCVLASNLDGSGADLGPTDQEIEVNQTLVQRLGTDRTALQALDRTQGAAFNALLHTSGFGLGIEFDPLAVSGSDREANTNN